MMPSAWKIKDHILKSRILLGTSGYPSLKSLLDAIESSSCEIVTLGIRRINLESSQPYDLIGQLKQRNLQFLPNTAGCYTANDAVLTAKLAREALHTDWIKLEVIGDSYSLRPDDTELLKAAKTLVRDGFTVFPYTNDDPIVCEKLQDLGCACVMPLGSPIGSGQGISNPQLIAKIVKQSHVPVIVDAGLGTASHACLAAELGCDAILINTAVAKAEEPSKMALAMKKGFDAGRLAFEAGRIPEKKYATPSTPERGKLEIRSS